MARLCAVLTAAVCAAILVPAMAVGADARLGPLKDLNGYFPFTPPASRDAWESRAEEVRRRVLVSQGLWPPPTKQPLNPVIHGTIEKDGYTVSKVFFESLPGFFAPSSS